MYVKIILIIFLYINVGYSYFIIRKMMRIQKNKKFDIGW